MQAPADAGAAPGCQWAGCVLQLVCRCCDAVLPLPPHTMQYTMRELQGGIIGSALIALGLALFSVFLWLLKCGGRRAAASAKRPLRPLPAALAAHVPPAGCFRAVSPALPLAPLLAPPPDTPAYARPLPPSPAGTCPPSPSASTSPSWGCRCMLRAGPPWAPASSWACQPWSSCELCEGPPPAGAAEGTGAGRGAGGWRGPHPRIGRGGEVEAVPEHMHALPL
jgi:hypothetical protein